MRRITCIGSLVLLAVLMISSVAVAQYDSTDRVLITVKDGNMQMDESIGGALFYDNGNVTLPWMLGNFDQYQTKISFHFTDACRMTGGFWNERVFGAGNYTAGQWVNETLYGSIHQGGGNDANANDTWTHINITTNNTAWEATVYYYLDDVAIIDGRLTATEVDEATPDVGDHWSVSDTFTFGTLPFPMDISLLMKYPTTAIKDDDFYWNATGVDTDDNETFVFQKYGPAQDPDDLTVTGTSGDVTIAFESKDKIKDGDWTIVFADEIWGGKFAGITAPVVKMNGDLIDADDMTLTTESLTMNEIVDVVKEHDGNELTVTWTIPAPAPVSTEQPVWYLQSVSGFPIWLIGAVIAIIAVVLVMASKGKK